MTGRRLGVVTFGHSGGAELGDDLSASVPGCEVHEQGLLDDLSEASLRAWQVGPASEDAREFLAFAAEHKLSVTTHEYPLDAADRALADLKAGRFDGAAVLVP